MRLSSTMTTVFLASILPAHAVAQESPAPVLEEAPEGVRMLLPRGKIPAIFQPEFVSATQADIPDSAWILGVALGGEARAYSLNLLNGHEVVNDRVGDRPIAAVW